MRPRKRLICVALCESGARGRDAWVAGKTGRAMGDILHGAMASSGSGTSFIELFLAAHIVVQDRHGRAAAGVRLVVGDHHREAVRVSARPHRGRPLRADVLVGPVAGGALQRHVAWSRDRDRRAVRRRDARVEAIGGGSASARSAESRCASKRSWTSRSAARWSGLTGGSCSWRRSARRRRSSDCSAPSGAS